MLRSILIFLAWIIGICAAITAAYYAYQNWVGKGKNKRFEERVKQQVEKNKEKFQKKESKPCTYACPSCQGNSTDKRVCSNCKQEISYD